MSIKTRIEIYFFKKVIKYLEEGYGADCHDYERSCCSCQAKDMILWMKGHITMINED